MSTDLRSVSKKYCSQSLFHRKSAEFAFCSKRSCCINSGKLFDNLSLKIQINSPSTVVFKSIIKNIKEKHKHGGKCDL